MCPTKLADEFPGKTSDEFPISDKPVVDLPETDVTVLKSGGLRIPAHSHILVTFFFTSSNL